MNTTFCWRLLYKRNYKVMALTIFFTGMTFPYWVLYFKTNMFALKTTKNGKIEYPFILCNFLISLIDFVEKTAFTICCLLWFYAFSLNETQSHSHFLICWESQSWHCKIREGRTHPRMIGSKRLLLTFVVIAAQPVEDLPSSLPRGRIYGGTDAEPGWVFLKIFLKVSSKYFLKVCNFKVFLQQHFSRWISTPGLDHSWVRWVSDVHRVPRLREGCCHCGTLLWRVTQ